MNIPPRKGTILSYRESGPRPPQKPLEAHLLLNTVGLLLTLKETHIMGTVGLISKKEGIRQIFIGFGLWADILGSVQGSMGVLWTGC